MKKEDDSKRVAPSPQFIDCSYDYRNCSYAGKYRGVGEAGKIGTRSPVSGMNGVPAEPSTKFVVQPDEA